MALFLKYALLRRKFRVENGKLLVMVLTFVLLRNSWNFLNMNVAIP